MTEGVALRNLRAAISDAIIARRSMTPKEIVAASIKLISESGQEFPFGMPVGEALAALAGIGSVEAIALLVVSGVDLDDLTAAITAFVDRAQAIKEDLAVEHLTVELEQFAEGEVAAGRMTKTKCPKTGRWLYATVDK